MSVWELIIATLSNPENPVWQHFALPFSLIHRKHRNKNSSTKTTQQTLYDAFISQTWSCSCLSLQGFWCLATFFFFFFTNNQWFLMFFSICCSEFKKSCFVSGLIKNHLWSFCFPSIRWVVTIIHFYYAIIIAIRLHFFIIIIKFIDMLKKIVIICLVKELVCLTGLIKRAKSNQTNKRSARTKICPGLFTQYFHVEFFSMIITNAGILWHPAQKQNYIDL